ncbi:MAG: nucleotidyl transferase AbiEii/AbiGii toxin family protein [Fibrobacterales bacterium]
MISTKGSNIPHSIHQKLQHQSRLQGRPFNELLQYYVMERVLFRLSQSQYVSQYILKGAMMLRAWSIDDARPTKDIDLLSVAKVTVGEVVDHFSEILSKNSYNDGLIFDISSLKYAEITKEADYPGLRMQCRGALGNAKVLLLIDIGIGDVVVPEAVLRSFPVLLDMPHPEIKCYQPETSIAEKVECMFARGDANSRIKDFYDVWFLSKWLDFDGVLLTSALQSTCKRRSTTLYSLDDLFTDVFISRKQIQWKAFIKKFERDSVPEGFSNILTDISIFLKPVIDSILNSSTLDRQWLGANGWKN